MSRKSLTPLELPGSPTQPNEAATKSYVDTMVAGGGVDPHIVGEMKIWPLAILPSSRWLKCEGQEVSRTTYSALHALVAAAGYPIPFGPGNGSTTFTLPDAKSRLLRGAGSFALLGQVDSLGAVETARSLTHTHVIDPQAAHAHFAAQGVGSLAASGGSVSRHSHGINQTSHTGNAITPNTGGANRVVLLNGEHTGSHDHGGNTLSGVNSEHTHNVTGQTDDNGLHSHGGVTKGNTGTESLPFITLNLIIYAGP
jgi:microcystin-dependent protein